MKHSHTPLVSFLTIGAIIAAGLSPAYAQNSRNSDPNARPLVLTPPAVQNGSTASRAPFPAARVFDDIKAPDGKAIDDLPPNTPATNNEPPLRPAPLAILQPTTPAFPAGTMIAVITPEQGLTPTGRPTVSVTTAMDPGMFVPKIHATTVSTRGQLIADIEQQLKNSEAAMASVRGTSSQMSVDGRNAFSAAASGVKGKADALRKSINDARSATDANWGRARSELASSYEAYTAELARVDAALGATPAYR